MQQIGGTFIDIGQPMSGHPELMQDDDVHPNTAGQVVLASTIQDVVNGALETARTVSVDKVLANANGRV